MKLSVTPNPIKFHNIQTAPLYHRGLGKAGLTEGVQRLQKMGCTRMFANAYDPPANERK